MISIKFNVYGKKILVTQTNRGWNVDIFSDEGKKRPAPGLFIPDFISESEIEQYLADICHEWATEKNPDVKRI